MMIGSIEKTNQGFLRTTSTNEEDNEFRTLLLCKVTVKKEGEQEQNRYEEVYKGLYAGALESAEMKPEKYITLGGFDALSVYTTYIDSKSEGDVESTDGKWLRAVLADRKKVLEQSQRDVSYHPIHLVRKRNKREKTNRDASFLLVIFVYGVRNVEEFDNNVKEQLKGVEIYECINISDRVLLYYTNNIGNALVNIDAIEAEKNVRKIYTTISIPLENGKIKESSVKKLKNQQKQLKDIKGNNYGILSINIRGSIRNPEKWAEVVKGLPIVPTYFCNYGEDDFIITSDVCGEDLVKLLTYLMDESNKITDACWDIHTELQIKRERNDIRGCYKQDETQEILEQEYGEFEKYLEKVQDKADWTYVYKELFTVQRNLDRHPLLKGSAYMIYDCLHIANEYFNASVCEDSKIFDVKPNALEKICQRNQIRIERFVRCLGKITDQLTRNDDVIFHGIGRIPAIAATLPENLLEFYHAFLRILADYLTENDREMIESQDGFEYAFLLSPQLNQRMRVYELFELPYDEQKEEYKRLSKPWPLKQVYIIELPSDDVFWPCDCFFALAHECFHKFGEKFRCREERRNYMAAFVSASVVDALGADSDRKRNLHQTIFDILRKKSNDRDLYMEDVAINLSGTLGEIMSEKGMDRLAQELKAYYLYFEDTTKRIKTMQDEYWMIPDNRNVGVGVISDCAFLFRECYADFMAISTLGIKPKEYLHSFEMELTKRVGPEPENPKAVATFIQRIAVVLAACTFCFQSSSVYFEWERSNVEDVLKDNDTLSGCVKFDEWKITELIQTFFRALLDGAEKPFGSKSAPASKGFYSIASLSYVMGYLKEVHSREEKMTENEMIGNLKDQLRRDFDKFLRMEHVFGKEFHTIVYNNRKEIETRAREPKVEKQ